MTPELHSSLRRHHVSTAVELMEDCDQTPRTAVVVWVSVASPVWTSASDVDEYLQRLGATGPIGIDDDWTWFGRYKVSEVPTTVVLGRDGAEVARQTGGTGLAEALAHVR